jgi:hypothetical protein
MGIVVIILCIIFYKYIYKFAMIQIGYNFTKPINFDSSIYLRVAPLEECISYFWKYRGIIYARGSITDDLFTRVGCPNSINHESKVLNALDDICMNPKLLCPVSYYKVVCHMADRKNDAIRNKAYETLLLCISVIDKCVTVECIQLLKRMFIDCGRIDVKEHAVAILCEISHSTPNLITFDIYDILRSYKSVESSTLPHAIEITLQEIKNHCIHINTEIDEYEKRFIESNNSCIETLIALEEDANLKGENKAVFYENQITYETSQPQIQYHNCIKEVLNENKSINVVSENNEEDSCSSYDSSSHSNTSSSNISNSSSSSDIDGIEIGEISSDESDISYISNSSSSSSSSELR